MLSPLAQNQWTHRIKFLSLTYKVLTITQPPYLHNLISVQCPRSVFKSVAVAKLVYAASAWYGFCTAADKDRLEAVIRRGKRSGFCPVDQPTVREMVDDADDTMFSQLINSNHALHQLMPPSLISDLDITIFHLHINLTK